MTGVGDSFLIQAFSKKPISKQEAVAEQGYIHPTDRAKKPAKRPKLDAAATAGLDADVGKEDEVWLIAAGAMGAFVHGLEDEFSEVRLAAIFSISRLASRASVLQKVAVEALIDMVNDEIAEVRIASIQGVGDMLQGCGLLRLNSDQLNVCLSGLHSQSGKVVLASHRLRYVVTIIVYPP